MKREKTLAHAKIGGLSMAALLIIGIGIILSCNKAKENKISAKDQTKLKEDTISSAILGDSAYIKMVLLHTRLLRSMVNSNIDTGLFKRLFLEGKCDSICYYVGFNKDSIDYYKNQFQEKGASIITLLSQYPPDTCDCQFDTTKLSSMLYTFQNFKDHPSQITAFCNTLLNPDLPNGGCFWIEYIACLGFCVSWGEICPPCGVFCCLACYCQYCWGPMVDMICQESTQ